MIKMSEREREREGGGTRRKNLGGGRLCVRVRESVCNVRWTISTPRTTLI